MNDVAELLLHIRDEHTRRGVKARLRRHFGEHVQATGTDADGAISPGPSNVPQAPESTDADIAFPLVHHITLDTLFDFQTDYWGTQSAASSMPTLDDELALWEILDMDADGEEVPGGGDEQGFDIDTLVDSILSSS